MKLEPLVYYFVKYWHVNNLMFFNWLHLFSKSKLCVRVILRLWKRLGQRQRKRLNKISKTMNQPFNWHWPVMIFINILQCDSFLFCTVNIFCSVLVWDRLWQLYFNKLFFNVSVKIFLTNLRSSAIEDAINEGSFWLVVKIWNTKALKTNRYKATLWLIFLIYA